MMCQHCKQSVEIFKKAYESFKRNICCTWIIWYMCVYCLYVTADKRQGDKFRFLFGSLFFICLLVYTLYTYNQCVSLPW